MPSTEPSSSPKRADYTATPALTAIAQVSRAAGLNVDAVGWLVFKNGALPKMLDTDWETLEAAGFEADVGTHITLPSAHGPMVLIGVGDHAEIDLDGVRDAAASAARATARFAESLAVCVDAPGLDDEDLGRVITEGAILGRYRYRALKAEIEDLPLVRLTISIASGDEDPVDTGIAAGLIGARAALVARDLCNSPGGHLNAVDLVGVAQELGAAFGFGVTAYGPAELADMGCGGLLGVNAGSTQEARMIVLEYTPNNTPTGHLGLVGKGITYDSGGISLKPSDPMHLLMKMDMGGAAAVLGAFTTLRDFAATAKVTAWLMCTDNMPSGSATKLGDVLTARGGKTVEVKNTDAEGRLVMMDGLVLATEANVDAVIDIATLTGASLVALGKSRAALFGTSDELVAQVERAATEVDEPVWRMPLEKKYRKQLDSDIADIANIGGPFAGATTAALFLWEFVGDTPWAHLDIASTMQSESDDAWRSKGATGYGARLLARMAAEYTI
jgi:leucyl aminopeptidase